MREVREDSVIHDQSRKNNSHHIFLSCKNHRVQSSPHDVSVSHRPKRQAQQQTASQSNTNRQIQWYAPKSTSDHHPPLHPARPPPPKTKTWMYPPPFPAVGANSFNLWGAEGGNSWVLWVEDFAGGSSWWRKFFVALVLLLLLLLFVVTFDVLLVVFCCGGNCCLEWWFTQSTVRLRWHYNVWIPRECIAFVTRDWTQLIK